MMKILTAPIKTALLLTWLVTFALASPLLAADEPATIQKRLLVITAPGQNSDKLVDILKRLVTPQVDVTDSASYAPLIDLHSYDGFVYVGEEYYKPPKAALIKDLTNSQKPIVWMNYHGWLLGNDFFQRKGLTIKAEHDDKYKTLITDKPIKLTRTDSTRLDTSGDKVLYWFYRPGKGLVPAAARSGNFTYVAYNPGTNPATADYAPFRKLLISSFSHVKGKARPVWKNFEQRIADIRRDRFRTGVHMPVYVAKTTDSVNGYDSDYWHANLLRIKNTGAEWVSIVAIHYQEYVDSSTIQADPDKTPTFDALKGIIADAHKLGLYVRLHFVVNIAKPKKDEWRGFIKPKNRKQWWQSYNALALKFARFCRENEVESLVIGAELNRMQTDTRRWRALIKDIRTKMNYGGLLGYQVNFNAMRLKWAKHLDYVTVAAYWPISKSRDTRMTTIKRAWDKVEKRIRNWKRQHPGVPIEFGEAGYVAQRYAGVFPFSWKPDKQGRQNVQEQLQLYRGLHYFHSKYKSVTGVHFFASTNEDTDPNSIGYTPFGKPAENVMKKIIGLR
jgi:hypothetical protein